MILTIDIKRSVQEADAKKCLKEEGSIRSSQ